MMTQVSNERWARAALQAAADISGGGHQLQQQQAAAWQTDDPPSALWSLKSKAPHRCNRKDIGDTHQRYLAITLRVSDSPGPCYSTPRGGATPRSSRALPYSILQFHAVCSVCACTRMRAETETWTLNDSSTISFYVGSVFHSLAW